MVKFQLFGLVTVRLTETFSELGNAVIILDLVVNFFNFEELVTCYEGDVPSRRASSF